MMKASTLRKLKAGKGFEALVHDIEKTAGHGKAWAVEAPMFRRDRTTGKKREFDIGITFSEANHKLIQAFECRDRSRKIDVPAVEAFAAKCADCGVHRGIIVSARGFHKTAITKARHLNVGCLTLAEARAFNWLLAKNFGFHNRQLIESGFLLTTGDRALDDACADAEAYDARGQPITLQERKRIIEEIFHKAPVPSTEEHLAVLRAHIKGCPWFLKDRNGKLHPVAQALLTMKYRMTVSSLPLDLHFYRDDDEGKLIREVASARVSSSGRDLGRMVLIHDETGTSLNFVPNPEAGPFNLKGVVEYVVPSQQEPDGGG